MKRPRLTAFCVLLLFVAGSGFVLSQEINDAYMKYIQGYSDEFNQTEEQRQNQKEYDRLYNQLVVESGNSAAEIMEKQIDERLNALGTSRTDVFASGTDRATLEERMQVINNIVQDVNWEREYALQQKIAEKEKEIFPDAQKRQQRQFQLQEGISRRLESFDDPADIDLLLQAGSPVARSYAQPDFLELTPEQKDLIKEIQKETSRKLSRIRDKSMKEQTVKQNELIQLSMRFSAATTDEERDEIHNEIIRKTRETYMDALKDCMPELKATLIEGRESYMRVLTDAQKAKIKAVMDDMPDYMRNLFAAIDKQGGGLSILHNWQPGMGVPGVNPNREAPRERTRSDSGRAFPS